MVLDNLKILQRILYCFHFFRCRMFPGMFQFFYCIRGVIHRQAQTSLYLCYISSMYFETIFSFYVFLYHFVCNSLFRLVRLGSLCDIIQRYFTFTFTKLDFYVDMSIRFFVGKQYYRLDVNTKLEHIPTKSLKYGQYLYSTNTVRASLFPQNIYFINFAPP